MWPGRGEKDGDECGTYCPTILKRRAASSLLVSRLLTSRLINAKKHSKQDQKTALFQKPNILLCLIFETQDVRIIKQSNMFDF